MTNETRMVSVTTKGGPDSLATLTPSERIAALLSLDDLDFIDKCYIFALRRPADSSGRAFHLRRLRSGVAKEIIVHDMATSDEAKACKSVSTDVLALLRQMADAAQSELKSSPTPEASRSVVTKAEAQSAPPSREAGTKRPSPVANLRKLVQGMLGSKAQHKPFDTLWIDLTTSMEWAGGVVDIIRAELELARGLKKIDPGVRFSMQIENGFVEIPENELKWLLEANNVAEAYLAFFGRVKTQKSAPKSINVTVPAGDQFFHPYRDGDLIVSFGWMDSKKEHYFSKLKTRSPKVKLCYLIYDIVRLLEATRHFYPQDGREKFNLYIRWISHNADFLLFGGETAKRDTEKLQAAEGWPQLPGRAVKFGSDIAKSPDPTQISSLLAEVGVSGPFILAVGSIEPRNNHDSLYRAYLMAMENLGGATPQLVMCGDQMWRVDDLVDRISRDPRIKGKVILATPTDAQLAALYTACRFTLLPSVYEGWSLALPAILGHGKFCLTCDTPPLREIAGDLVEYVAPFDIRGWADQIIRFASDDALLAAKERQITAYWPQFLWSDTADMVYSALSNFEPATPSRSLAPADASDKPTIWMDMTVTFLQWGGGVNGIVRAELTIAYYLKKIDPNTHYFAYENGCFFEIPSNHLDWLFDADDLATAYDRFHEYFKAEESAGTCYRSPFVLSGHSALNEAYLQAFPENSIVFFAAIDWGGNGNLSRVREVFELIPPGRPIMTSQLVYDFTPILFPQLHMEATCFGYTPFLNYISNHFDHIVYGGRTAQRDGLAYQRENDLKSPASDFLEFGSDLDLQGSQVAAANDDDMTLHELGVVGDFIMTVGTIEPRKNHETLYKAYLRILERNALDRPLQIVFVGKKGWKSDDFLETLNEDNRVAGKILHLSPNDAELAALYRNCKFTLLPSFYEGWSLTLPESLSYGKFCLVSDSDPLRETGGDLVEYIHPLDTFRWAERIEHYANHPEEVAAWERRIAEGWRPTTWRQSTERLVEILHAAFETFKATQTRQANN
jgi:glycosyltransferase involved in cell wall biosynthesis